MARQIAMAVAAAISLGTATQALSAEPVLQIGTLECTLEDKTNFVAYSSADYACDFTNNDGSKAQFQGKIQKIGIDLTIETAQQFNWLVLAPSLEHKADALEGDYAGASANVAALGGAGIRVLVGGSSEQVALQPFSTSGHAGFGAAVGIESFSLTAK